LYTLLDFFPERGDFSPEGPIKFADTCRKTRRGGGYRMRLRGSQFSIWALTIYFVVLLATPTGFAQNYRGGISGTVEDASDAAIPNASIHAVATGTGVGYDTTSSSAGRFEFRDLPLGTYQLTITVTGFSTVRVDNVPVSAGLIYNVPVTVSVARQSATVEVSADALSLDTSSTALATVMPTQAVQDIPRNARDYTQNILLVPGSNIGGGSGVTSINGMRSNSVNWQIEGNDDNDAWWNMPAANQSGVSAIAATLIPMDAIDEFSFIDSTSPESGRNSSGTANVVIKSGTNQLHGSAYYFNRNEALAANSPFAGPGHKNELRNENDGASLGGPIWRNKTFFFASFEHQNFEIGNQTSSTEPSLAYQAEAENVLAYYGVPVNPLSTTLINNLWPASALTGPAQPGNYRDPNTENGHSWNGIVKLDENLTEKDHISFKWYLGQGPQRQPTASFLAPYYQVATAWVQNYSVIYNRTFSANLTNQLGVGVNYIQEIGVDADISFNPVALGLNTGVTNPLQAGSPRINIQPSTGVNILGGSNSGFDPIGVSPLSGRNDTTWHLNDVLSYSKGAHQLRFGGEVGQARVNSFSQVGQRGAFGFDGSQGPWDYPSTNSLTGCDSLATRNLGTSAPGYAPGGGGDSNVLFLADFLAGCVNTGNIVQGNRQRAVFLNSFSLFGQDSWQMTRRLNLNYGARYDYTGPLHNGDKDLTSFNPNVPGGIAVAGSTIPNLYERFWKGISPRVGFAFQPRANGNIVVRGAFALAYDTPFMVPFLDLEGSTNGGPFGVQDNPAGTKPDAQSTVNSFVWQSGALIFPPLAQAIQQEGVVNLFSVDPHWRQSLTYIFNFNVQQSLGKVGIAQIGYVGTQSRHLMDLIDVNQAALGSAFQPASTDPSCLPEYSSAAPGNVQCSRPYYGQFPNFGVINQLRSGVNSNFNSLQAVWRTQAWHGLSANFSYTWSHALDFESGLVPYLPQDSTNLRAQYGNSDFDVRNQFTGYMIYVLPTTRTGSTFRKAVSNGWQLNDQITFRGGEPFTVGATSNTSGNGEYADRANQIGNPFAGVSHAIVDGVVNWYNPAAFANPAPGTYGTSRRGQYRDPGFGEVDLSVFKNTPITERFNTQFRVEMFNLFNRTNLAPPGTPVASAGGSPIGSTLGSFYGAPGIGVGEPFNVQLALKIIF
jgi:Carboxypeptidase regulatory-like domain/TonB dependent receptor